MTDSTRRPVGLINLTYISECLIPADEHEAAILRLLAEARGYNRAHGITGALLATTGHFVQTLEGRPDAVDALMASIERDTRHRGLMVIDRREVAARNFGTWSMAYSGASVFVAREVLRPAMQRRTPDDVGRLLRLMREFTAPRPRRRS